MVNRMRSTKGHTGNRRSHHALDEARLSKCVCGAYHRRHHACQECGMYRGNQVIDVVARAERDSNRESKRLKNLQAMGMAKPEDTEEKEHSHEHEENK